MLTWHNVPLIASIFVAAFGLTSAQAGEFDGAWANDKDSCEKMFTQTNGSIVLTKNADFYGSGFIIDGATIRGKSATCKIKSTTKNQNKVRRKVDHVIDLVHKSGGIDYTIGKMNEYKQKALAILDTFPESEEKKGFIDLVNYVTDRKY